MKCTLNFWLYNVGDLKLMICITQPEIWSKVQSQLELRLAQLSPLLYNSIKRLSCFYVQTNYFMLNTKKFILKMFVAMSLTLKYIIMSKIKNILPDINLFQVFIIF